MKAILRTAAAGVAIASFGIASAAAAATNDEAQVTAEILTALSVDVVAGDDTLLCVASERVGGVKLAATLRGLAESHKDGSR